MKFRKPGIDRHFGSDIDGANTQAVVFTVGTKNSHANTCRAQIQDLNSQKPTTAQFVKMWLSTDSAGATIYSAATLLTASAIGNSDGVALYVIQGNNQTYMADILTSATGTFTWGITTATTYPNLYMNVEYGGQVYTSPAIATN